MIQVGRTNARHTGLSRDGSGVAGNAVVFPLDNNNDHGKMTMVITLFCISPGGHFYE